MNPFTGLKKRVTYRNQRYKVTETTPDTQTESKRVEIITVLDRKDLKVKMIT